MRGHHRQRMVDVGKVRTLIWCRRCAGWASEHGFGKRLGTFVHQQTQGYRISSEGWNKDIVLEGKWKVARWRVAVCKAGVFRSLKSLCHLHHEGTLMAQRGQWHRMEKKLVEIPKWRACFL